MSPTLISLMMAAGGAAVVYSKFGRRIGYGNSQNVWFVTGLCFVLIFIFFITFLKFVIRL